ncbi:DUF6346 domain-containing protein [Prauserella flavalba]|uniref:DUF6346 domain-containing protein n=1 Tax=Prauserella flavalba TaxID=1477506 RepID=UPI0011B38E19|nr:DUF6346 domain-containing protein [Prauserella flavalba]
MSAPNSAGGRIARVLVWWGALVLGLLVWATLARITDGGGPEADLLGTAEVADCTEHGPVSTYGFGTTYTCSAEVRWSDGTVEKREFPAGQLSPADAGTPVPVYLDLGEGYRSTTELGRNGSARFADTGILVTIAFGLLVVVLGVGALYQTYRLFRPETDADERPRPARGRKAEQWPVTSADLAAAPASRLVLRLRLLSLWCVVAAVAVALSSVPRLDAERAPGFVSPWPQIQRALLVDVPTFGAVLFGGILAVLLFGLTRVAQADAARVRRYGAAYLARGLPGKGSAEKKVNRRLAAIAAVHRRNRVVAAAVGLALLALAAWAGARAAAEIPADAPLAVVLACLRDTVLLALLAALWLGTVETRHQRLRALLAEPSATTSASKGTEGGVLPS